MKNNIFIVGAGGFGREVFFWANDSFSHSMYIIKGFIVKNLHRNTIPDINLPCFEEDNYCFTEKDFCILAIGDPILKRKVFDNLSKKNVNFITLIHPSAIILSTAKIGIGVIVCPFSTISTNAIINDFALINLNVTIGHDVQVGSFSTLSPHVSVGGYVRIGENCFIGSNASISPSIKLSDRTYVSSNTFVIRNTRSGSLVSGVPGIEYKDFY